MNNKNTTEVHYPTPGNTIQTFIKDLPGEQLELQAHNPNTGEISALKDGAMKIDKTAPAFTAAADGQLTLTDNFSGIWKLGGYDAAAKSCITGQIGKYRAVDAAGNASVTQAVTVNDPLAVTPQTLLSPCRHPSRTRQQRPRPRSDHRYHAGSSRQLGPPYGGRFTAEDAKDLFDISATASPPMRPRTIG